MCPSLFAAVNEMLRRVSTWRSLIFGFSVLIAALTTAPGCAAQKTVDVSTQVTVTKSGLVLNRATNTFNTVVTITNSSASDLNGPLLLVISNVSATTVTVANQSGKDPSGNPYVYVLVPEGSLPAGKSISNILLKFNNPSRVAFTFGLSVSTVEILPEPLPEGVSEPLITSLPPTAAIVGKLLKYQVIASSNNPTSLAFSLSAAPAGMTINATTGLVQWTPAPNEAGDQPVTIVAQDSGGQTSQSFTLSCFGVNPLASALITAASGGVITVTSPGSPINGLSISIPAGALSANTTIGVSQLISPPTFGGAPRFFMAGFSVDPDGTTLAVPATITIPYNVDQFSTTQGIPLEDFLGVYFLQASTGNPELFNSFIVNKTRHVLTGTVSHFSGYLATNIARLCSPTTVQPACPGPIASSTAPPSLLPPVVLVHGFQAGVPFLTLGNEGTWGQLRFLLGGLDSGNSGRIDAWRFDWDSAYTSFERSAANLNSALTYVESVQSSPEPHLVNLVAHSFGGILVRTYLEGFATDLGPIGILGIPYRNDVNRVMTLGTPHQGIGGDFSTIFASACAAAASILLEPFTCFEADSGGSSIASGAGSFLRLLNSLPVPALQTSLTPQYDVIIGQRMGSCSAGVLCSLQPDDGLITTAGNQLCGGSAVNPLNVCSGLTGGVVTEINPNVPAQTGLCHSGALLSLTCGTVFKNNIAMAAVNDTGHPLWNEICHYVGCKPAINVTLSDPSAGTVTSSPLGTDCGPSCEPPGINCGSSCTALFDGGTTVTLTATASGGTPFSGWSGDCTGTAATCVITVVDDDDHLKSGYQVTATFSSNRFAGVWNTNIFGCVTMFQNGNTVTASYTGPFFAGGFSGTITGTTLNAIWRDNTGTGTITLQASANSLSGSWASPTNGGPVTGVRVTDQLVSGITITGATCQLVRGGIDYQLVVRGTATGGVNTEFGLTSATSQELFSLPLDPPFSLDPFHTAIGADCSPGNFWYQTGQSSSNLNGINTGLQCQNLGVSLSNLPGPNGFCPAFQTQWVQSVIFNAATFGSGTLSFAVAGSDSMGNPISASTTVTCGGP
jgi:Putative Ig domain/Divergent InlB B-repeat domain